MSCGFLYIAGENIYTWKTNGRVKSQTKFSKIGKTESKPWERLRKLQQGNPRDLEFTYLWVGPYYHVSTVESLIKGSSSSEWFNLTPEHLREHVCNAIANSNYKLVEITKRVPYYHHSYGTCYWHKNKITPNMIYEEISGEPVPDWRSLY